MTERIKATGIEAAVITSWAGWDGDHEGMYFYGAELRPEIKEALVTNLEMPEGITDVEIDLTKLVATVNVYSKERSKEHSLIFSHLFELKVTANLMI